MASTINTLAGALYKVFCASPDPARKEMRQACFDYLSLGGIFSNGPVALLSGLNPRPLSLVLHFFAVAVYGVWQLIFPFPSLKRIYTGARLISVRAYLPSELEFEDVNVALLSLISLFCFFLFPFFGLMILFQGASSIIFPIIRVEGIRQMFFPFTVPAYYRAPPVI